MHTGLCGYDMHVDSSYFFCMESIIQLWCLRGHPRSRKGTQYPLIKEEYCLCHLDTGDMLREVVSRKTPLGIKDKEAIAKVKFKT